MNDKKKIAELKAELKAIKAEKKAEIENMHALWEEYHAIEGKYAEGKIYDDFGDMHYRGYDYKYAEGMYEKEQAEMHEFFVKNNLRSDWAINAEYAPRIYAIEDALCHERYGMSKEQRNLRSKISAYEEAIKDLEREIEERKKVIEELKSKLI